MKKKMMDAAYKGIDGMKVSEVELVYRSKVKAFGETTVCQSKEVYKVLRKSLG